ncbi:MAG: rod shape-determining protein MreD [Candidatus Latescibacteria bacterium]|nr:rod shape-determining protein MreD [Candidatus Latescibacterota bacterium]
MSHFLRTTLALGLLALLGDTVLAPLMTFGGIGPDFSLIAVAILALAEGAFAGTVGGFVLGLVIDTASPDRLGLSSLAKSLAGFAAGRARARFNFGIPAVEGTTVAILALAHDALHLLVLSWTGRSAFIEPLFTVALPSAVITGLVAIPLLRAADLLGLLNRDD